MTTKPNRSTGIKGLSFNKSKRSYVVYETKDGVQIIHGARRDLQKALELHRQKIK